MVWPAMTSAEYHSALRACSDGSAFEAAFAAHHVRLGRLAFALTGDSAAAEDLVAETFARVWARSRRAPIEELGPYLRRTLVNLTVSRTRRWHRERRHAATRWFGADETPSFEPVAAERHSVRELLLALPAEQRAVIVLRHLEDLSEQETARLLGIRCGTVKSRLARGLDTLRTHLAREEGE